MAGWQHSAPVLQSPKSWPIELSTTMSQATRHLDLRDAVTIRRQARPYSCSSSLQCRHSADAAQGNADREYNRHASTNGKTARRQCHHQHNLILNRRLVKKD